MFSFPFLFFLGIAPAPISVRIALSNLSSMWLAMTTRQGTSPVRTSRAATQGLYQSHQSKKWFKSTNHVKENDFISTKFIFQSDRRNDEDHHGHDGYGQEQEDILIVKLRKVCLIFCHVYHAKLGIRLEASFICFFQILENWKLSKFIFQFLEKYFFNFRIFGKMIFQKLENKLETFQFSKFWKKQMNDANTYIQLAHL